MIATSSGFGRAVNHTFMHPRVATLSQPGRVGRDNRTCETLSAIQDPSPPEPVLGPRTVVATNHVFTTHHSGKPAATMPPANSRFEVVASPRPERRLKTVRRHPPTTMSHTTTFRLTQHLRSDLVALATLFHRLSWASYAVTPIRNPNLPPHLTLHPSVTACQELCIQDLQYCV
ncbi:hypothetical protein FEAC_09430 [Ferrimicrobium acidiphilum DSM 19497]|uniref:Uncharacterized protein n=1 Tax=Ferrimicrobium acidiphilum DSM 19497 TaxID=1121877 RepID=A0A0D8FVW4_9ACTN|nr:hypothetical protein FEAC_09430 [Ferrimicrobium acidiphilum DSM 19497]